MSAATAAAGGPDSVLLQITVEPGEPIAGTIGSEGAPPAPFCGWIDLMAAITAARGLAVKDHRFP